jgi:adenosylcobinamide kinase/adenosylcobinamide-phosphate guanylyltransferase
MAVVLVGGGARSGKSSFAQSWVEKRGGGLYIATAEAGDEEMRERIARHQADRGELWRTLETPLDLVDVLSVQSKSNQMILVDCLTLWVSNVLIHPQHNANEEIAALATLLLGWAGPDIILVTNEVGCGIVPDNPLSREFRDLAGRLNQQVADAADEVYWIIFGQALRIKPFGGRP